MIEALTAKHGADSREMSPEQTGELHDAWAKMIAAQPWNQIDDGHIIAHHHPTAGDAYTIAMGQLGEVRGISAYLGETGFESLISLLTGGPLRAMGMDIQFEPQYNFDETDAIFAVSADREELSDEDRRILRQAGLRYRGRGNWAQIQRTTPGFLPYRTDANEGRLAKLIIQDLTDIAAKIQQKQLDARNWMDFSNLLHSTFDGSAWHHEWGPMPKRPDFPEDVHVDMDELKALPAGEDRWLVTEDVAGKVKEPEISHRPFLLKVQTVVDLSIGLPRWESAIKGPATSESRQRGFAKSLLDGGQLPASVIVQDEPTFMALQSITDDLGIQMLASPRKYRAFPER